jgi:hypothetical protein
MGNIIGDAAFPEAVGPGADWVVGAVTKGGVGHVTGRLVAAFWLSNLKHVAEDADGTGTSGKADGADCTLGAFMPAPGAPIITG